MPNLKLEWFIQMDVRLYCKEASGYRDYDHTAAHGTILFGHEVRFTIAINATYN